MKPLTTIATLLSGLAVAAVTACAVKDPPPAADALRAGLPPTTTVPAAWTAAGDGNAVVTDWVRSFGDPRLDVLVEEGLQNNLDLKVAATRIDVAAALVVQARSLLYPQVFALGSAGLVGRDSVHDRTGLVGEVTYELDLWGRVRAQAAAAAASREAIEADLLQARHSLAAVIATLWFQTVATERLRQTALEASGTYDELLRLMQMRRHVGKGSQQEVVLASADLNRSLQRERGYAGVGQQSVRGLEVVVGRYPSAELALAVDLPPVPGPVPDGLPAQLLERRADLVAASRRVAAAFHTIQSAEAARLPKIALTFGGGRSTSDLLRLAQVPPGFWRAGLDIMAPLLNGGSLRAQVDIANADQQAALALYAQAALRAFSEVESSLANELILADQERYLAAVLDQDTEGVRLGTVRYEAGASNFLDVLQLQSRQLSTRFDLIRVRNDRLANRVALHLALGGGFAPTPAPAP
jgi:outer membrane protein, multidrug efflux system